MGGRTRQTVSLAIRAHYLNGSRRTTVFIDGPLGNRKPTKLKTADGRVEIRWISGLQKVHGSKGYISKDYKSRTQQISDSDQDC